MSLRACRVCHRRRGRLISRSREQGPWDGLTGEREYRPHTCHCHWKRVAGGQLSFGDDNGGQSRGQANSDASRRLKASSRTFFRKQHRCTLSVTPSLSSPSPFPIPPASIDPTQSPPSAQLRPPALPVYPYTPTPNPHTFHHAFAESNRPGAGEAGIRSVRVG